MSNIFDLFGAVNNTPSHQHKRGISESMINSSKLKTFTDNKNAALKNSLTTTGLKPKGLSMRPQSDPNIRNINSNQITDKITPAKPTLKSTGINSNIVVNTPRNNKEKVAKLQTIREKQRKGLSPVSKSPHAKFSALKQTEEFKFKKPKTPSPINMNRILYPEPEKLSNYCDQEEFDRVSLEKMYLDEGFNNLIASRNRVMPFEDEGFISEPELLDVPSLLPIEIVDTASDSDEDNLMAAPEIPIVSDDDNDNF